MKKGKKVTWNPGQVPERRTKPQLPIYTPTPDIHDPENRDAWSRLNTGEMLLVLKALNCHSNHNKFFPYPVMQSDENAWAYAGDLQIPAGQVVVYLGITNVDCLGSKGRVISKPYSTVFFNGNRLLVQDPNHLKPLT